MNIENLKKFCYYAACLALLSGCAHRVIEYGGAKYDSTTFASDTGIADISIVIDADGSKRLIVHGFGSEQTKALEAVARGAAAGAKGGL